MTYSDQFCEENDVEIDFADSNSPNQENVVESGIADTRAAGIANRKSVSSLRRKTRDTIRHEFLTYLNEVSNSHMWYWIGASIGGRCRLTTNSRNSKNRVGYC